MPTLIALSAAADREYPRKQRTLNAIVQRRNLFMFNLPAFWICPKQKGPWNTHGPLRKRPWAVAKPLMASSVSRRLHNLSLHHHHAPLLFLQSIPSMIFCNMNQEACQGDFAAGHQSLFQGYWGRKSEPGPLFRPQGDIHVLHRLTGCAFQQVVNGGHQDQPAVFE